jgi:hypothetical protein
MELCKAAIPRRARLAATVLFLVCATIIGLPTAAAAATPMFGASAVKPSTPGPIADMASIYGSGPAPTGTITLVLYGPDDTGCGRGSIFSSVRTVTGNGMYSSDWYTPTTPGTYRWVAVYSGDANYTPAATACGDPNNTVLIGGNRATVTAPASTTPGAVLTVTWGGIQNPTSTDWIAFHAVGAPDSAVRAWRYTGGTSGGSTTLTVPWGTPRGNYEVRLFYNNSMVRLATSNVVAVS